MPDTLLPPESSHEDARPQPTNERLQIRSQDAFVVAGGFGLLSLLVVTLITELINPVFPLAALLFFLYPWRRNLVARRTMQLGGLAFIVWVTLILSGALLPFIISFVLAYLFAPLVDRLYLSGIPRWTTALTVVLGIVGIYALIGIFVVPAVVQQLTDLVNNARGFLQNADTLLGRDALTRRLTRYGLSQRQAHEVVTSYIEPQMRSIVSGLFGSLTDFLRNVTTVIEGVFTLILIPVLTFSIMVDFPRIRTFVHTVILRGQNDYIYYIRRVDSIVSAYLRGILITSSMVGAMAVGVLSAFDVPYAVMIGILTGAFNLIPTVGMFLNLGVAMLIYLFAPGNFWLHTLITVAMIAGLHLVNSYLIEPRVLGHRVGLHPVLVIASLFIFGYFLGFTGLLIAVPTSAVLIMFLREWNERDRSRNQPAHTASESE